MSDERVEPAVVGVQIGFVHADDTYFAARSTPTSREARSVRARRYLDAGAPRKATEFFRGVHDPLPGGHDGDPPNPVGPTLDHRFHHALGILSNRSLYDVVAAADQDELKGLLWAPGDPLDGYGEALWVLTSLVSLSQPYPVRLPTAGETAAVVDRFTALPTPIRAEISRHLDRVLGGHLGAAVRAAEQQAMETERESARRRSRAPLFFEPDPARPEAVFDPATASPWSGRGLAAALSVLAAAFAVLLVVALDGSTRVVALLLLAGMLVAGIGACWGAVATRAALLWSTHVHSRLGGDSARRVAAPDSLTSTAARRFRNKVNYFYDSAFWEARPEVKPEAKRWARETQGLRLSLRQETVAKYEQLYRRHPERLAWLARHHAARVRHEWQIGRLKEWPDEHRADPAQQLALPIGGALAAIAAFVLGLHLILTADPGEVLLYLLATTTGATAAVRWTDVLGGRRAAVWIQAEADEELLGERERWSREELRLRDRPSDADLARWLDLDLRHIRAEALRAYHLAEKHVFTHLILVEAAEGSLGARMPGGPARYTDCVVTVFLFTDNGVRRYVSDLDVRSGRVGDHRWQSFHYGRITSAVVTEVGVRTDGRGRRLDRIDLDSEEDTETAFADPTVTLRSAFVVTLVDRDTVGVLLENHQEWSEGGGDSKPFLFDLALESSGVRSSRRVMGAVAVEGHEWIGLERERYRWADSLGERVG